MSIWFKSKDPAYSWLSNFSEIGFEIDGVRWRSVEHYYQAQKHTDPKVAERIRKADSPLKARKAGQDRSLTPRDDWDAIKLEVMRRGLDTKFTQNRRWRTQLIETGEEELLHESSSDLFWGRTQDGDGENMLGELLMEIRKGLA